MSDHQNPQPDSADSPRPEGQPAEGRPGSAPRPQEPAPPPGQQAPQQPGPWHAGPPPQPYPQQPYPQPFPQQLAAKPPSPFKKGFGLGAGAGLGAGLALIAGSLVASIIGGLTLMGVASAGAAMAGSNQISREEVATVWGPATAKDTLRSIPIRGAIQTNGASGVALSAGTYGYEVADVLDSLKAGDAGAVVLTINTPGGSIAGARAISDAADRYRERTGKKVYAFVEDMSASGGMYAMAGADQIVAEHGAVVGSIGVIMGPLERYHNVNTAGSVLGGVVSAERIDSEYITAGTGKDSGNPFRDMTPAERAEYQGIVDSFYSDFVDHVASKRGIERSVIVDQLGAGIFAPPKAKEVGLIDEEMGRDEAMRRFASDAGLDPANTRLVESKGPDLVSQLLGVEKRAWGTAPAAQPIGGQPARATATICTDARTPLAFYGEVASVCG